MPLQVIGADPLAGRAALAEARAVLPQAAVRARRGIGEAVTEVLRERPAGAPDRGRASPSARRSARSTGSSTARSSCGFPAGACTGAARASRSSSPSPRTTSSAGSRGRGRPRLRRVVRRRRLAHRRPPGLFALLVRNLETLARRALALARLDRHRASRLARGRACARPGRTSSTTTTSATTSTGCSSTSR